MGDLTFIHRVSVLDITQVFEAYMFTQQGSGRLKAREINITLRLPLGHLAREEN